VLVGTIFAALAAGVDFAIGRHFTPLAWLIYLIGYWLALMVIKTWTWMGVWRSARFHAERGGRRGWARAARILIGLSMISTAYDLAERGVPQVDDALQFVAGDAKVGPHKVALAEGGKVVDVSGGITFGLTDEVQALLDANPGVKIVRLDSVGGRVGEAHRLRDLIRERQLWTYVERDCMSACTMVYLGGVQRWVGRKARFGFHQPLRAGVYEFEMRRAYAAAYYDYVKWGVEPRFAQRAMSTPSRSMWFPTPYEVVAGRVANAIGGYEFLADQAAKAPLTAATAEHLLVTNPLFGVIEKFEPTTMKEIYTQVVYNTQGEPTVSAVVGRIHPLLTRLHYKYLPVASDAMVVEGAEVLVEEIRAMRARKAAFCAFFLGQHREGSVSTNVAEVFDEPLMNRFMAAVQGAIETGNAAPQTPPTREVGEPLVDKLFARLAAENGRDVEVFGQLEQMTVDPVKACAMVEKLFEAALALPEPERVTALRYLFVLRR